MTKREGLKQAIEQLVDAHGLQAVSEELVEVCWDKAEHLSVNWQDQATSKVWQRCAAKLGNAVHWKDMVWPS